MRMERCDNCGKKNRVEWCQPVYGARMGIAVCTRCGDLLTVLEGSPASVQRLSEELEQNDYHLAMDVVAEPAKQSRLQTVCQNFFGVLWKVS